ncbi:MAG: hypothetical protein OXB88_00640 [Bacteriovoracales bacterium]|nr:hypothetical protein [Bacteriovoracales bacterium]
MRTKKDFEIMAMRQVLPSQNQGQALLEFILLFALIIGLSFGLLVLVNGHLATRWTAIANKIVGPAAQPRNDLTVKLR